MPDARVISHAARGWRLAAGLVVVTVAVAAEQVWQAERRSAALRDEVAGLRSRLADRRELIAHQRREMTQVASAVDHLARTTGALGERGAEARRLAHMEESRAETRALVNVAATLDGGMSVMSEDAGRALEQLAWLDGQAAAASSTRSTGISRRSTCARASRCVAVRRSAPSARRAAPRGRISTTRCASTAPPSIRAATWRSESASLTRPRIAGGARGRRRDVV